MTKRGFSIRIFLPSGAADGLRIVEKSNWSGRDIVCPRSVYTESKTRDDFERTGIYILIGPSEPEDVPMIYVGEGDPVRPRLNSHYAKKDFWTTAIFFVSKDENLNKAHIKYIESRLISLAATVNRCVLDNSNCPVLPNMSEMDIADAEGFLDEMLLCLPLLGINVFAAPEISEVEDEILLLKGSEAEASGYEAADGFVVLKGGRARQSTTATTHHNIRELRESLLKRKVFVPEADHIVLAQNYTFSSPSQAAAVMMGRSANGRIEWKTATGRTLKELQEASDRS